MRPSVLAFAMAWYYLRHLTLHVLLAVLSCRHTSPAVLVPALRTVGNIVTGNDMQTQVRGSAKFPTYVM
jgi:hypothetical protein